MVSGLGCVQPMQNDNQVHFIVMWVLPIVPNVISALLLLTLMGLGLGYLISPLRPPPTIVGFVLWWCFLVFGLWSFLFFFSSSLARVFFLYLFAYNVCLSNDLFWNPNIG